MSSRRSHISLQHFIQPRDRGRADVLGDSCKSSLPEESRGLSFGQSLKHGQECVAFSLEEWRVRASDAVLLGPMSGAAPYLSYYYRKTHVLGR
jgi:hypothetical protein